MSSIIVSDLVPLVERGAYQGIVVLAWAFAAAIGPIVVSTISFHYAGASEGIVCYVRVYRRRSTGLSSCTLCGRPLLHDIPRRGLL